MGKKLTCILLLTLVLCVGTEVRLFAQAPQTGLQKQSEKVKAKIGKLGTGERVIVRVRLYNETNYQGYLKEANAEDFVIVDKAGSPNTLKYIDVKSVGGKNLSTGAKIAIGVGIGAGLTLLTLYLTFVHITRNN